MPRKKSEEQKERIAEAATDIFIEKGYKGTSLQDIAQSVGITKAGIYHYFKTKEEILYYILVTHDKANIKAFQEIRHHIEHSDMDDTTILKTIIRAYAKLSTERQNINLLGLRERDQLTGERREDYRKNQQGILSDLKTDIGTIQNIKKSLDLNTIIFMVISVSAWFGYWHKEDGKLTLEEAIEQSIDIICHGVIEQ